MWSYISNKDISISNLSVNKHVFENNYIFVNSMSDIYLMVSESAKEIGFCPFIPLSMLKWDVKSLLEHFVGGHGGAPLILHI